MTSGTDRTVWTGRPKAFSNALSTGPAERTAGTISPCKRRCATITSRRLRRTVSLRITRNTPYYSRELCAKCGKAVLKILEDLKNARAKK